MFLLPFLLQLGLNRSGDCSDRPCFEERSLASGQTKRLRDVIRGWD